MILSDMDDRSLVHFKYLYNTRGSLGLFEPDTRRWGQQLVVKRGVREYMDEAFYVVYSS